MTKVRTITCEPAECDVNCTESFCPYIHRDIYRVDGESPPFYSLADAEKHVSALAQERYEDNMAEGR